MKLDKLKVNKKYSSIIPNAETIAAIRAGEQGETIRIGHPGNLIKYLHTCLENDKNS